ncbi:MAG: Crp/Fnr family transcriptional regulator [Bacteroidia bacterium]|jgi:CRP-like cAMP-binding protein|nr:Crp/Fnr family transcriptional regulator [Bacteroidia bacterium]
MSLAIRLKQSFAKYFDAPLVAWEVFSEHCSLVYPKKNEILKRAGNTEFAGYFILRGSGGVFVNKEHQSVCLDLFYEDAFFCDYMSLITQQPSPLETVVLEDSEMLFINRENIHKMKDTPMGKHLFLTGAEWSFVEKQQQQIDLLLKTAEERYFELIERQPDIILRTPQKYIASYLGITTQSLSRIRKRIKQRK